VIGDDEWERYARQLVLPGVGPEGQARLAAARVLVVGLGGLGSPAAQYMAAAGVGRLTLVDNDAVEASNLPRQPLYGDADVGLPKAAAAAGRLRALNRGVEVVPLKAHLTAANAAEMVRSHYIVIDGTDTHAARYALAAGCRDVGVPMVHGAVRGLAGQAALFPPGGPCYRCLVPRPPPEADCGAQGVLGPVAGVIGSLQALLALAWLLELRRTPRCLLFDGLKGEVREVALARRDGCELCGGPAPAGAPPAQAD